MSRVETAVMSANPTATRWLVDRCQFDATREGRGIRGQGHELSIHLLTEGLDPRSSCAPYTFGERAPGGWYRICLNRLGTTEPMSQDRAAVPTDGGNVLHLGISYLEPLPRGPAGVG